MFQIKTYIPSEVYLTFGGHVVEGWNSMSVKRANPTFRVVKGIGGKNTRVVDHNTLAEITLNVDPTSLTNDILMYIVDQDKFSGNARLEVSVLDSNGSEVFSSQEAFVRAMADREYSDNMGSRDWVIDCLSSQDYSQRITANFSTLSSIIEGFEE